MMDGSFVRGIAGVSRLVVVVLAVIAVAVLSACGGETAKARHVTAQEQAPEWQKLKDDYYRSFARECGHTSCARDNYLLSLTLESRVNELGGSFNKEWMLKNIDAYQDFYELQMNMLDEFGVAPHMAEAGTVSIVIAKGLDVMAAGIDMEDYVD